MRVVYVLFPILLCVSSAGTAAPVINEFVARPGGEEGEWVEILNPGPDAASLEGWFLLDATGKAHAIRGAPVLESGGLLVLAARPESLLAQFDVPDRAAVIRPDGWPVLNDRDGSGGAPADVIVILRPDGTLSDSVAYFEAWLPPEAGRSLERGEPFLAGADPGAWGWSMDPAGATPGRPNTLALGPSPSVTWAGPDEVDPSHNPAVFQFRFPGPGTLAVWLVDREGRELAVLQEPRNAPAAGRWIWSRGGELPPRPGYYFVCVRWQSGPRPPIRRCRSVWVSR
jgi:hypothetical protein